MGSEAGVGELGLYAQGARLKDILNAKATLSPTSGGWVGRERGWRSTGEGCTSQVSTCDIALSLILRLELDLVTLPLCQRDWKMGPLVGSHSQQHAPRAASPLPHILVRLNPYSHPARKVA